MRRTGHSRKLVHQVTRGEGTDIFRIRQSSLEAHMPMLDEMWNAGCHNGAELWRRLKAKGFRGSLRVVGEWASRRRRAERASDQQLRKLRSARTIAHLMRTARDHLSKSETVTIAAIDVGVPMLVEARCLVDRFQAMIRTKAASDLDPWITEASTRPGHVFRQRHHARPRSRPCGHHGTLVERTNGGADHEAQAGEATDVWAREARSPASQDDRRRLIIEIASEPRFGAI